MFNYNKLLGKIRERGLTQAEFAKALGTTPCTLSLKLSNKAFFKQEEIKKACDLLDINAEDLGMYFFCDDVQKN